jgi:addiction module HigA family antidote
MNQNRPPHPGEVLRKKFLDPMGLSVAAASRALGIARKNLSLIVNGHAGVSPETAVRLSLAFNTTPETWLDCQRDFDLWQLRERQKEMKVEKLAA